MDIEVINLFLLKLEKIGIHSKSYVLLLVSLLQLFGYNCN